MLLFILLFYHHNSWCYFFVFYYHLYLCLSRKNKYTKKYTCVYLNICIYIYIYHIIYYVCVWRNYDDNDDNNVFPTLFQRALFFPTVVDIPRAIVTWARSKPRLNAVCQPFKTDFQTCKQLDFDASLWAAFCIRLS